jgi:hypothetical protein
MKKGALAGELVDYFAILFYIVFFLIMFTLFQLKGSATNVEISQSMESISDHLTLNAILESEVGNLTIGELFSEYLEYQDEELKDLIVSEVSIIFKNINYSYSLLRVDYMPEERYLGIRSDSAYTQKGNWNIPGVPDQWCGSEEVSIILPTVENNQMKARLLRCK